MSLEVRVVFDYYPDVNNEKDNVEYLELASKYGCNILFLELFGVNGIKDEIIKRYKPYTKKLKN